MGESQSKLRNSVDTVNDIENRPVNRDSIFDDSYSSPGAFRTPPSELSPSPEPETAVAQVALVAPPPPMELSIPTETQLPPTPQGGLDLKEEEYEKKPEAVESDGADLQTSVFTLTNVRSGSTLDVSGADGKTLIGYPFHGGQNQQWQVDQLGPGCLIRGVAHGTYLTFEDDRIECCQLVMSEFPVTWKLESVRTEGSDSYIRIQWPNGKFAAHLADDGSGTPGAKVQLRPTNLDDDSQVWRLSPCSTRKLAPEPVTTRTVHHAPPVITAVGSDGSGKTVKTTTTVTTVTTVTEESCGH
ncbi:hypothetical protein K474DRAFT_1667604 [Panus rudis PR-1116 ss-1]|nr:hypothetical protein K474DRAFT_1667604 [Panus rudis PR-1116 ss-1]